MVSQKTPDIRYYDRFSKVYDWISSKRYYHAPRQFAIQELNLQERHIVLNIPCGTGQNFDYFQPYLKNTGLIVGIDLSAGMLTIANNKIRKNHWTNVQLFKEDAVNVQMEWIKKHLNSNQKFDAILCDLGLSGIPHWETVIDNMLSLLQPNGKIVIMDWYMAKPNLRGKFIQWIGKGEVTRPIYQYLETRVNNFQLNNSFKKGEMFVASGTKRD